MTMWCPDVDHEEPPLYQAIARALKEDIQAGQLRPGDRLPTHRELAHEMGVARGTVTRAYAEAERLGLVKSEVGRGTYVCETKRKLAPPLISLRAPRPELIDLSVNYPVYCEDPDLGPLLGELAGAPNLDQLLRYQSYMGMDRHRAAGAEWARRYSVDVPAERVLITGGAQHALNVLLSTLTRSGDLVLCDQLTYPGFKAVANLLDIRLVGLPMDEEGLIPDALESICLNRPVRALYCMPTIQNPTGSTMSRERRERIASIVEKHGAFLIEDDVHRLHRNDPPPTLHSLIPERTFFIAATGKALAGGLRVAYLIPPQEHLEQLGQSIWATAGLVAPLCAEIATRWIESGTADRTLERKERESRQRQTLTREILGEYPFRSEPSAMFVWFPLPEPWTSADFAVEARRRGVAVTPSRAFTVGCPPPAAVRICTGAAESVEELREGLKKLRCVLECEPGCGAIV